MADYNKSLLYDYHLESGAKIVPYCGWSMVQSYGDGHVFEQEYTHKAATIFDNCFVSKFRLAGELVSTKCNSWFVKPLKDQTIGTIRDNLIVDENGFLVDKVMVWRMKEDDFLLVSSLERKRLMSSHLDKLLKTKTCKGIVFDDLSEALSAMSLQGIDAIDVLENLECDIDELPNSGECKIFEIAKIRCIIGAVNEIDECEYQIFCSEDNFEDLWIALYNTDPVLPIGFVGYNNLKLELFQGLVTFGALATINPCEFNLINAGELALDTHNFVGKEKLLTLMETVKFSKLGIAKLPSRRLALEKSPLFILSKQEEALEFGEVSKSFHSSLQDCAMAYIELKEQVNIEKSAQIFIKSGNDEIKAEIIKVFNLH